MAEILDEIDSDIEEWTRLAEEGLNYEDGINSKIPFPKMSQKFGRSWIRFLCFSYAAWDKDIGDDDEFCRLNGDVPKKFFENKVKPLVESVEIQIIVK